MSEYDEKIKTLDRKLEFSPVVNQHPKRLTKEQISFYNEQGYLSPFAIFEPGLFNTFVNKERSHTACSNSCPMMMAPVGQAFIQRLQSVHMPR